MANEKLCNIGEAVLISLDILNPNLVFLGLEVFTGAAHFGPRNWRAELRDAPRMLIPPTFFCTPQSAEGIGKSGLVAQIRG